jgi:hypothetical protein
MLLLLLSMVSVLLVLLLLVLLSVALLRSRLRAALLSTLPFRPTLFDL